MLLQQFRGLLEQLIQNVLNFEKGRIMEIPNAWASLLISSVRDAALFHEQLLTSETLKDRADYEEHLLQLNIFLEFLKEEYRTTIEAHGGMPLARFLPDPPIVSNIVQLQGKAPSTAK